MQPGSLKEREGYAPDQNDDELNPANRGGQNDTQPAGGFWRPEGWDDEYPGDDQARPNKKPSGTSFMPSLGREETGANPLAGNMGGGLNEAENAMSAAASSIPKINTSGLSSPATGWNKILIRGITRKRGAQIGGGAGLIGLMIGMYMAGASLYLVHLKETLTGSNNRYESVISNSMQRRRVNSLFRLVKSGSQKIQSAKLVSKLKDAGFDVTTEKGFVKTITKGDITLDLAGKTDRQLAKEVRSLAKGSKGEAGRLFISSIDEVSSELGSRFVGKVVKRNVFKRYLGILGYIDWIKARESIRAGPSGATDAVDELPPNAQLGDALINANKTETSILSNLDADVLAARLGLDPANLDPSTTVDDLVAQYGEEAANYKEALAGANGEQVLRGEGEADRPTVLSQQDELAQAFSKAAVGSSDEVLESAFKAAALKLGSRIWKKASSVLSQGFDVTGVTRQGCRVAGTLEFVKSVRNTLMAIELAKFAVRFFTVADHQQAGLASNTAIKLMSIYLAGATGSSGFQSILTGGAVSAAGVAQYGTGYADVGILAAIAGFLRKVPGLDPNTCKVVNNPLVQIGGTLTGGALAVLSGGTSVGLSLGWSLGLTVANEVAFSVVTPILIGSLTGALVNGFENPGEDTGNLLSAASGAFSTMSSGASAGLPISASSFASLSQETEIYTKEKLARKSFSDRYLNIKDSESLVARASLYLPQSLPGLANFARSTLSGVQSLNFANQTLGLFSSDVSAAGECEDISVKRFNVATDGFCNPVLAYVPILDLEQTKNILKADGQIGIDGQPTTGSNFQKFIDNCFSGRAGILHPVEINTDGSTDPIDPSCVVGENDEQYGGTIPGDVTEEVDEGYAERVPSRKERYAAWYGYLVDEENLAADINDELSGASGTIGEASNNKIYFLGDSLTVGMQNLAGTDPTSDYLKRTFNAEGWNTEVNAQGCRAVYQSQGAFSGDGASCPAQTIVDGISAINSDVAKLKDDQFGTFVIGLGTNRYETENGTVSPQLFSDKVKELVNSIRTMSPRARIYWVNLTSNPDSQGLVERNEQLKTTLDSLNDQNTVLLDWNDFVKTANASASTEDDVGFADQVHHTSDGYVKKVSYLLDNIALPAGNTAVGAMTVNCDGYQQITAPNNFVSKPYNSQVKSACETAKQKCLSGVASTERILCSAMEFDGTYYGNRHGSYKGDAAIPLYGFSASASNYGGNAKAWLDNRSEGLSANNLLDCSGLTSVALYRAYGQGSPGCSGSWTAEKSPRLFRKLTQEEIRPGDILTISFGCDSDANNPLGGHVAIAASPVDENGNLVIYDASGWGKPVKFSRQNIDVFKNGGKSRYIGPGASE